MSSGLFITFEGGEGTGKSTQLGLLAEWFRKAGRQVVTTREPGGTAVAEAVRTILLDPHHDPDGLTELFLLEAARRDHVVTLINPALDRGTVVLSDRFADSSTVYQGMVRNLGAAVVRQLNVLATGALEPDLTLILDMDPEIGLGRAKGRNAVAGDADRIDDEPLDFHRDVREAFLRLAHSLPGRCRVIDATGSEEVVFERVRTAVAEFVS